MKALIRLYYLVSSTLFHAPSCTLCFIFFFFFFVFPLLFILFFQFAHQLRDFAHASHNYCRFDFWDVPSPSSAATTPTSSSSKTHSATAGSVFRD